MEPSNEMESDPKGSGSFASKVCSDCGQRRAVEDYYKSRHGTPLKRCKVCHIAKVSGSRKERDTSAASRRTALARYGLTLRQYEWLLEDQGGACSICGEAPTGSLHVDHDHAVGPDAVRGLLCAACNLMLGCARDDRERLRAGIAYLSKGRPEIPHLPRLCACGEPSRTPQGNYCKACALERIRSSSRASVAAARKRARIEERGADISYAAAGRTHCPAGHEYDAENTYVEEVGDRQKRHCRLCAKDRAAKRYQATKAESPC